MEIISAHKILKEIWSKPKSVCPNCSSEKIGEDNLKNKWYCKRCHNYFVIPLVICDEGTISISEKFIKVSDLKKWCQEKSFCNVRKLLLKEIIDNEK